jgi:hypothetical protein
MFHLLGETYVIKMFFYMFQPASRILLLTDHLVSDGRNLRALEQAVGAALSFAKVELVLTLLQGMKDRSVTLRPHYFWPLFIAASKNGGEKGWQYVLDHLGNQA